MIMNTGKHNYFRIPSRCSTGSYTHSLYAATAQKYFPVLHENNNTHPDYGGHDGRFRAESFFIIVLKSAVGLFFHRD